MPLCTCDCVLEHHMKPCLCAAAPPEQEPEDPRGRMVACVMCSMNNAEAFLPAPFPTRAPVRFYVANLGVAASWRRQGIARAVLRQCERLGMPLLQGRRRIL